MRQIHSDETSYFSAEFKLGDPGIFYQFKLRKNMEEPLFALLKKGSRALESINAGDSIPMVYHFRDKTIPPEKKITRIKDIVDGNTVGFNDHFLVALDIGTTPDQIQQSNPDLSRSKAKR